MERSRINKGDVGTKYATSNLTCNNGVMDTGCVCLTDGSKKLLGNRGYVKRLPMANGMLDQDNRISAFKIMEDEIPRPMNILGQTTELTGTKRDDLNLSGKYENKTENRVDKYKTVKSSQELAKNMYFPINTNVITIDNEKINIDQYKKTFGDADKNLKGTDLLLKKPLGKDTRDIKVNRK